MCIEIKVNSRAELLELRSLIAGTLSMPAMRGPCHPKYIIVSKLMWRDLANCRVFVTWQHNGGKGGGRISRAEPAQIYVKRQTHSRDRNSLRSPPSGFASLGEMPKRVKIKKKKNKNSAKNWAKVAYTAAEGGVSQGSGSPPLFLPFCSRK